MISQYIRETAKYKTELKPVSKEKRISFLSGESDRNKKTSVKEKIKDRNVYGKIY